MKHIVLVSALCLPFITGCVVAVNNDDDQGSNLNWSKIYERNRTEIANMQINQDYQSVITKLGTPNFSNLVKFDDNEYRVLYYATNSIKSDGKITKDECTPVVFKDNKLTGWGELALKQLNN